MRYEGEFYRFSLLTDFFSPGPSDFPDVPISVAGVNPGMARLAGEVFDGFHVHPFHSRRYLDECLLPAIAEGAAARVAPPPTCEVICPVFTIVGDTEAERAPMRESVRQQLSFYGSTRTYRPVFELHGWADTSEALHRLMAAGDTDAMAAGITDEMLDEYAVTATWDDLADRLVERYRGVADRLFTYQPAGRVVALTGARRPLAAGGCPGQRRLTKGATASATAVPAKKSGLPAVKVRTTLPHVKSANSCLVEEAVVDQLPRLDEDLAHVGHVPVADVRREHGVEPRAVREQLASRTPAR